MRSSSAGSSASGTWCRKATHVIVSNDSVHSSAAIERQRNSRLRASSSRARRDAISIASGEMSSAVTRLLCGPGRIRANSAAPARRAGTYLFRVENGKLRYVHTMTHLVRANFRGRSAGACASSVLHGH
jgi:hypothetical protein